MAEEIDSTWNSMLFLFMGWLLGLLSPLIVDAIKKRHRQKEIRNAIISELSEARYFLASNIYVLESDFGTYDRKLLEWLSPIFKSYKGPNPGAEIADGIDKGLSMDDAHLAIITQMAKAAPGKGINVKQHRLPYLESRLADLGAFDETSQALLFDIRTKLDLFNEQVDEARFYFRLTFESGISEQNHHLAEENLLDAYRHMSTTAHLIIDRINQIAPLS